MAWRTRRGVLSSRNLGGTFLLRRGLGRVVWYRLAEGRGGGIVIEGGDAAPFAVGRARSERLLLLRLRRGWRGSGCGCANSWRGAVDVWFGGLRRPS